MANSKRFKVLEKRLEVRLNEHYIQKIKLLCKKSGLNQSELLRYLIDFAYENRDKISKFMG